MTFTLNEIEDRLTENEIAPTPGCMFCEVDRTLIVGETANFWLIRDKYPVVDGHLMVISKTHYGCMGELPAKVFAELESLRPRETHISYEHGRAGHCVKLKGSQVTCHHFHLHFLPIDIDIRTQLAPQFSAVSMTSLAETPELFAQLGEYLFFETSRREKFFYPASQHVESHLLRTVICRAISRDERADWEAM